MNRIGYSKEKTKFLVDGFRYGFRLQHQGEVTNTDPHNDSSISDHYDIAENKIQAEVSAGRMKGPFTQPPFKVFHASPQKIKGEIYRGKV